jgi:chromosome segregation ATPase
MPDIVTNVLYQDIDRLQEKVKELEAENHRLIVQRDGAFERWKSAISKYPNGADGCCCLFDDNENQVQWCTPHAELRDENDALTAERDKLTARVKELEESRDSWKREWRLSNAGLDMAEKRIAELEAENRRLREELAKFKASSLNQRSLTR